MQKLLIQKVFNILKDIIIIIFCIVISYFALNNNYVRPHVTIKINSDSINTQDNDLSNISNNQDNNNWHIYKKEHKILLGISGHTFLELANNKNEVVEQIHGFAYDSVNDQMIETAVKSGLKLRVFNFDYDFYKDEIGFDFPAIELMSDNSTSTLEVWNKAKACGELINQKDINYPRYGFKIISETENSNSVAHSIANCAGLMDRQIGLLSPGARTLLLTP